MPSFNDPLEKSAADGLGAGSANMAAQGVSRAGTAAAPGAAARSRAPQAVVALLADELMSSPAIATQTTEPVFSVARLMLESGIRGVRCSIPQDVRWGW